MAGMPEKGTAESLPVVRECSKCGSRNVRPVVTEFRTGVVAPDGGAEWRLMEGVHCRDCGAIEEL